MGEQPRQHIRDIDEITVEVDTENDRVYLKFGYRTFGLQAYKASGLANALHVAVSAITSVIRERERTAKIEEARESGAVEVNGAFYQLHPERMHWTVIPVPGSYPPEYPPSWPVPLLFRVTGGRVLHAWDGGYKARCGEVWVKSAAERVEESDPRPRCRACFPDTLGGKDHG